MSGNQRWLEGRDSYRPPLERIDPAQYEVAPLESDTVARSFIERHHYSHSYPAARVRVGLARRGELVGVAVFSQPTNDRAITNVFAGLEAQRAVELGRFVLLDEVPGNGETWFLARCFELLRARGICGVLSFSDPVARTSQDGLTVFPGHLGTIYQAHNARYLGRSTPRTLALLPDGTVLSPRTIQKIRAGERGWCGAADLLAQYGAAPIGADAGRRERLTWLHRELAHLTRPLRHAGNHRYAWSLVRRLELPAPQVYPKQLVA